MESLLGGLLRHGGNPQEGEEEGGPFGGEINYQRMFLRDEDEE